MRTVCTFAIALAIVALLASPALAQPPMRGGGGPLPLLLNKDVQKDLKLTDDQIKKFTDLQGKRPNVRFNDPRMEEYIKLVDKTVADTLKADQAKRLEELRLQQRGARAAFTDEKIAEKLKVTADQKDKAKAISDDARRAMGELFQPGTRPSEEALKKLAALNKSTNEKLAKLLTDEQKKEWAKMTGDPFKGEFPPAFGGRRPGGGGGRPPA